MPCIGQAWALLLSDWWGGLDDFFEPGTEILIARTTEDTISALQLSHEQLVRIARSARERALDEHTAERRAGELEAALSAAYAPASSPPSLASVEPYSTWSRGV